MRDGKIRVRHMQFQDGSKKTAIKMLRVAAYCRVSTDMEEQESSYEAQCLHYTNFIKENPAWTLAGIYADSGQSGTTVAGRGQFHRMIAECEARNIDLILTKSISRFARNTVDCLNYIRRLKSLGIAIYFEKENINTLEVSGELLTTIMASIAQQESESMSKNIQIGIQYSFQQGKVRLNYTYFLGYTKDKQTEKLVIVPEDAEIIRRIYREFLDGYSTVFIANRFNMESVRTPTGKGNWFGSTVRSILQNEKYCGDLLLQKTYTVDVLTHKKVKNDGKYPQYFIEDDHDPIIPKPIFRQVQGEILRRSALIRNPKEIRFDSRYVLMGRLQCGKCGRILKRVKRVNGQYDWRCQKRASEHAVKDSITSTLCDCRIVEEAEAEKAILSAFNELPIYRHQLKNRRSEIRIGPLKHYDAEILHADAKIMQLEDKQSALAKSGVDENIDTLIRLSEQLKALEIKKKNLMLERASFALEETQIRFLLELMDTMDGKFRKGIRVRNQYGQNYNTSHTEGDKPEAVYSPACFDAEEFYTRTRHDIPESIMDAKGRMAVFDNELVTRYVDLITVQDYGYDIHFRAGLTISVKKPI